MPKDIILTLLVSNYSSSSYTKYTHLYIKLLLTIGNEIPKSNDQQKSYSMRKIEHIKTNEG